jgi:hypothetical protein
MPALQRKGNGEQRQQKVKNAGETGAERRETVLRKRKKEGRDADAEE